MLPRIVSYYTERTLYETEVLGLIESCQALGVPFLIEPRPCLGRWDRNCCMKPAFLKEHLSEPLLWVDADSVIESVPDLSAFVDVDMAIIVDSARDQKDRSYAISSALYLNPTDKTRAFLSLWDEECQRRLECEKDVWDQRVFADLWQADSTLDVVALPESYSKIYDKEGEEVPVISHFVASRFYKPFVEKGLPPDFLGGLSSSALLKLKELGVDPGVL